MKEDIDYIGVGIGAAIINADRKLFLALRGPKAKNERGRWETPGGTAEYGETMETTIIREMTEEYGITIEVVDQLHAYDHIISEEHQHWVAISYLCKLVNGAPNIREPEKCSQIGWFDIDEAKRLPLTITGKRDIQGLEQRYPDGLPDLYSK